MNSIQELYFTNKDVNQRWSDVKDDFWGDIKKETLNAVKRLIETTMDIEVQDLIGGRRWEHLPKRRNYRNGSYCRNLWTSFGYLKGLKIPRIRVGEMNFKAFKKYQQRTNEVNKLVMEMFLAGISTRRVKEVLEPLYGKQMISAQTVSSISKSLNKEVKKYHRKRIKDEYVYLFFDGVYLKAKSPIHSKSRCMLVAYGIKKDGVRELINFKIARKGESQVAWECFLISLRNAGLKGDGLKMIAIDGNKGLCNAVDIMWPNISIQRCWAHKLRNVSKYLPWKFRGACTIQARDIYDANNKTEAIKAFKEWSKIWKPISSKAVECIEENLEELLNFYDCPKKMRIKLRTTNLIERVFREVRRRTRPISCFTNTESMERIIFAVFNRQNNIWREKPLKEITQNS
ncbi:MAG: IS256 family transposase [Elusimicrobiales bacterium]|nr:IS256 family transposase [Elusimicrobiales bacterium]MCK5583504.1 IS256 family transposase [Elusimicrobiales bacterium]